MQPDSFLLYGANGYSGELIARYASRYALRPVLAGRRREALAPLAAQLNLPYKVIDLNDATALQEALREVKVVLHAAGPFPFTAKAMIEACLLTGTHYLDINGDISVFEMLKGMDEKAKQAGIMVLSGAGFNVVPSDCLGLFLKKQLPDAQQLKLAFASVNGSVSHGTAMSMVHKLGEKGAVRKNGKIIPSPLGQKGMWVDFGGKKLFVMSIPWGDIATAYFTTGIPNIETYTSISPNIYYLLKFQFLFNWLLRTSFVRNMVKRKINQLPAGPDESKRKEATSVVWGQVINTAGKTVTAILSAPDVYELTIHSSLLITKKVMQGNFITGYQTPASAYGADLVLEIPGVTREVV